VTMKDFAGVELVVGQEVAIIVPYYSELVKARVEKIGKAKVTCSWLRNGKYEERTARYPNQVIVTGNSPTDRDKFEALLNDWKVPYEEDGKVIVLTADAYDHDNAKVIGYAGFVTDVAFDDNGKFRRIGIWE